MYSGTKKVNHDLLVLVNNPNAFRPDQRPPLIPSRGLDLSPLVARRRGTLDTLGNLVGLHAHGNQGVEMSHDVGVVDVNNDLGIRAGVRC